MQSALYNLQSIFHIHFPSDPHSGSVRWAVHWLSPTADKEIETQRGCLFSTRPHSFHTHPHPNPKLKSLYHTAPLCPRRGTLASLQSAKAVAVPTLSTRALFSFYWLSVLWGGWLASLISLVYVADTYLSPRTVPRGIMEVYRSSIQ